MSKFEADVELEDIHYKYERLMSLISVLRLLVTEVIDIVGAPNDSFSNALYEIELEMGKTNDRLKAFITQGQ